MMDGIWQVFDLAHNRCRAIHSDKRQAEEKAASLNAHEAQDSQNRPRFIVMEMND